MWKKFRLTVLLLILATAVQQTWLDKYDLSNNLPQYPDGFAEPDKAPLYPQDFAEIMAGRLPISETRAESPKNLTQTLICYKTAREIGWMR